LETQTFDLINELTTQLHDTQEDISKYKPFPHQLRFHKSKLKHRWFIGGNRSGKTTAGAIEAIWTATGWHPYRQSPVPNSGWIVSIDFPNSRDVAQPKVFDFLPKWMIAEWNKSDQILKLTNGSIIGFKSCDSGFEKFQGADKDWIWFDEEPAEKVYKECIIRLKAGRSLQMWGTMTPLHGLSWTYDQIYKSARDDIKVVTATIFDNKALSKSEIAAVTESLTDYEQEARLQGNYTILAGIPVFSPAKLKQYFETCEAPLYQGYLEFDRVHNQMFLNQSKIKNPLKIWQPPLREEQYAIGADVSEGDNDASVAYVINRKKKICAEWYGRLDPDIFGRRLYELGKWYNDAHVGVERNQMGLSTIDALRHLRYPSLYKYSSKTKKVDGKEMAGRTKFGWRTDVATRTPMINDLGAQLRSMALDLTCTEAVRELADFIVDEKGDMHGQGRDDRVMALAITNQMHKFIPLTVGFEVQDYTPSNDYTGY
jgi:phage terminase large subunit-like protein